eukprot:PhM_4_TR9537/c0_g1_i1/m.97392
MSFLRTVSMAVLLLLLLSITIPPQFRFGVFVSASEGDESHYFQQCLTYCHNHEHVEDDIAHSVTLWGLAWTSDEECVYRCVRRDVERRRENDDDESVAQVQYYGAWGFRRVVGIEEPGSCVFSLIHMVIHLRGATRTWKWAFKNHNKKGKVRCAVVNSAWRVFTIFWVTAWLFSTLYHARHKDLFMKLDYLGAQAALFASLYFALVYTSQRVQQFRLVHAALIFALLFIFSTHAFRMLFVLFDFGLNMALGLCVGLLHHIIWISWWCTAKPSVRNQPATRIMMVATIVITVASVFEVFDFAPILWETTDAHACWHGSTIPVAMMWYKFAELHCKSKAADTDENNSNKKANTTIGALSHV